MTRYQFQLRRTLLVGVQEARAAQGAKRKGDYFIIASGHKDHSAGVELWVKLEEPYGHCKGAPLLLLPRHLPVLVAETRLLIARIQAPGLELVVAVAHVYHSGHKASERSEYWGHLDEAVATWGCSFFSSTPTLDWAASRLIR